MSVIPPIPVACKQEGRYKAVVHILAIAMTWKEYFIVMGTTRRI